MSLLDHQLASDQKPTQPISLMDLMRDMTEGMLVLIGTMVCFATIAGMVLIGEAFMRGAPV